MDDVYPARLHTLEQTWQVWAELGKNLTDEQWSRPARCPGWDVAALYAHCSVWPLSMDMPPPVVDGPIVELLTAADVLKRFNAPGGIAHSMAETVADGVVSDATARTRSELLDRFIVHGPRALQKLRQAEPTVVVPWPVSSLRLFNEFLCDGRYGWVAACQREFGPQAHPVAIVHECSDYMNTALQGVRRAAHRDCCVGG